MRSMLSRVVWWVAALLIFSWMMALLPVATAPTSAAAAGCFDQAKDKQDTTDEQDADDEPNQRCVHAAPRAVDRGPWYPIDSAPGCEGG